jgi:AP-1 complex subunit beta-1
VFVTRAKVVTARTDEEEYLDGNSETAYSETPSHVVPGGSPTAATTASTTQPASRAPPPGPAAAAPLPDLLGDLMGMDNSAAGLADEPATPSA